MSKIRYNDVFPKADEAAAAAVALTRAAKDAKKKKMKKQKQKPFPTETGEISPNDDFEDALADIGMVDPYTDEPIRTKADFLRWKQRFLADAEAQKWEEERYIAPDPMAHDREDPLMQQRLERTLEEELEKIRQWDSAVAAADDIAASEVFPVIYEKVMAGYSLSDAFYLANADRLQREALGRAAQAARNHLQSKEHLRTVHGRGGGEVHIPAEVMAEFKRLLPEADADAIRRFYRKDRAKVGKSSKK